MLLGCAVGAFVAGRIADLYGRRPTMLIDAALFLATAFATGAARSAGAFIAARLVFDHPLFEQLQLLVATDRPGLGGFVLRPLEPLALTLLLPRRRADEGR